MARRTPSGRNGNDVERLDAHHPGPAGQCAPHAYQRQLERGRWFYTPGSGWEVFVPDYVGRFRYGTAGCATENHVILVFLEMLVDQSQNALNCSRTEGEVLRPYVKNPKG